MSKKIKGILRNYVQVALHPVKSLRIYLQKRKEDQDLLEATYKNIMNGAILRDQKLFDKVIIYVCDNLSYGEIFDFKNKISEFASREQIKKLNEAFFMRRLISI